MQDTVLVVAEETPAGTAVAYLVGDAGFSVRRACDQRETLDTLRSCRCVAVVLDAAAGGFSLLEAIRAGCGPDVPVALLIARNGPVERQKALALGADAIVTKPFAGADLIGTLRRLTAGRSAAEATGGRQMAAEAAGPPHHG